MTIEAQIQQVVDAFVSQVTRLAQQAAIETLTAHLSPDDKAAAPQRTRGTREQAVRPVPPAKTASPRRPKLGAKRPKADIARLEEALAKHIEKNPGQSVEQINKALGTVTNHVRLPLAKLIDAGTVKTKGNRRATRYFPA